MLVFFDSGRVNFGAKDLQLLLDFVQNIHSFKRAFSQLFIDVHVYFVLITNFRPGKASREAEKMREVGRTLPGNFQENREKII
jgi:hypothetical protein